MNKNLIPIQFVGEGIEVQFDKPQLVEKKPGCPDSFTWQEKNYRITEKIGERQDFGRPGLMAYNMRPANAAKASRRWFVGGNDFTRIEALRNQE